MDGMKSLRVRICVAFAVLIAAAMVFDGRAVARETGWIQGQLTNAVTGDPLVGVSIDLYMGDDPGSADEEAWSWVANTTSAEAGAYQFTGLAPRYYRIVIWSGRWDGTYTYASAQCYNVPVTAGEVTVRDIELLPCGSIVGNVYAPDSSPLAGAQVRTYWCWGETDENGEYVLQPPATPHRFYPVQVLSASIPGGAYEVWGTNEPFYWPPYSDMDPVQQGFTYLGGATGEATFDGGYTHYMIRTPADYQALVDAVESAPGQYYHSSWGCNAYDLSNLYGGPDQQYALIGDWPGWASYAAFQFAGATEYFKVYAATMDLPEAPVYFAPQTAPGLYSSEGGTIGPDFTLEIGGTIRGRMVDEFGNPLAYAPCPKLLGGSDESYMHSGADENGEFTLRGLQPGVDLYLETPTSWQWYWSDSGMRAIGKRWLGPFRVNPGQTTEIPPIMVPPAGTVSGYVTGDGLPLDDVEIEIRGVDIFGGLIETSDEYYYSEPIWAYGGYYEGNDLPGGVIVIFAVKDGYLKFQSEPLYLIPGMEIEFNFEMTPHAETYAIVDGQIADFDAAAPKNDDGVRLPFDSDIEYTDFGYAGDVDVIAILTTATFDPLYPDSAFASEAFVRDGYDRDNFAENDEIPGSFSICLPQSAPTIVFAAREEAASNGGYTTLLGDPILVEPGQTDIILTLIAGTAKVHGKVIFPSGHPGVIREMAAMVYLRQAGVDFIGRAVAEPDASACYRHTSLPAGTYFVYAVAQGFRPFVSDTFTLAEGQTVERDVIFGNTGSVTLYVDDDAGGDPGPGDPTVSDPLEDGSTEHPFDSIQKAINAAFYGDTIIVRDGIYDGVGNRNMNTFGKSIAIRSENGPIGCIIDCGYDGQGITIGMSESRECSLSGFTIMRGSYEIGGGILCIASSPTISHNILANNEAMVGGAICTVAGAPLIKNNLIVRNFSEYGAGISCGVIGNDGVGPDFAPLSFGVVETAVDPVRIENNTIANNWAMEGTGLLVLVGEVELVNSILWDDMDELAVQIAVAGGTLHVSFSDVQGGEAGIIVYDGAVTWTSSIDQNPLLVSSVMRDDFHLKSAAGRWDPTANDSAGGWVKDTETSPCIDAGDPASSYANEPAPNGSRINMGFYGNTAQASKSAGWPIPGDVNGDCKVNVLDLIFVRNRLNTSISSGDNWLADVNSDGKINVLDLIYVRNRLNTKCP